MDKCQEKDKKAASIGGALVAFAGLTVRFLAGAFCYQFPFLPKLQVKMNSVPNRYRQRRLSQNVSTDERRRTDLIKLPWIFKVLPQDLVMIMQRKLRPFFCFL